MNCDRCGIASQEDYEVDTTHVRLRIATDGDLACGSCATSEEIVVWMTALELVELMLALEQ